MKRQLNGYSNGKRYRKSYPSKTASSYPRYKSPRSYSGLPFRLKGAEKKHISYGAVSLTPSNTAAATGGELDPATPLCLNAMGQGTTVSTRIGNKIYMTEWNFEGNLFIAAEADQTAADSSNVVMIALVLDRQTNGAQLNSEDVYVNGAADVTTLGSVLRDMSFTKRFKILKTWRVPLTPPTLSYDGTNMEQGGVSIPLSHFHKFKKPLVVEYSAAAGTVADIVNYSLHVVGFQTGTTARLSYNSRVRFYDS